MTKVKIFDAWGFKVDGSISAIKEMENDINQFGREHNIKNVSISNTMYDDLHIYCAAVTYEE